MISKNALSHLKRNWVGFSFVFSGMYFVGIELLHNYLASADIYTNAHLTSTIAAITLQPYIKSRILRLESSAGLY